jgi:hypothetical protein
VSAPPPAKKTAGQIEEETDVSYDLHGIRLRAQGVCMRFNLILFVLVLVVVIEIRILEGTTTRTKSVFCNRVWNFMKFHTSAAAGPKTASLIRKKLHFCNK